MCGVIGVWAKPTDEVIYYVKRLFEESQIRGKHATGLSYISNKIETIKAPIPAKEFIKKFGFDFLKNESRIKLIGHCRYSTSDLEFNQPIFNDEHSIVHNGVITQEDPNLWGEHFGYNCKTRNDSELILRSIESGKEPIDEFTNSSISAIVLSKKSLSFYRNGTRPLWYIERGDDLFIASTKDILFRVFGDKILPIMCEAGTIYEIYESGVSVYPSEISWSDKQVESDCSDYYRKVIL